ncbi:MAG: hypothetical protein A2087_06480 [Spirochaetes bacterium GWD1_61_31]|nr:MAG: hypothetical protein A2087_06480 [Spirochaetes bacterium GWD1_61_31]
MCYSLTAAMLRPPIIDFLYADPEYEWFCIDGWDADLYVQAARAGMISITLELDGGTWLAPQLQSEYALLEWPDRHLPRRLQRQAARCLAAPGTGSLAAPGAGPLGGVSFRLMDDPTAVVAGIQGRYGQRWLDDDYARLLHVVRRSDLAGFRLLVSEVRAADGCLLAGELGYLTGRVYTCLSGYVAVDAPAGVSWGSAQILALSQVLVESGVSFMNMGHATQVYKLYLGARILDRKAFLARWLPAVAAEPARLEYGEQSLAGLLGRLVQAAPTLSAASTASLKPVATAPGRPLRS